MKLPQLTLRDLFWLVLVAACLCAWWLEHRQRVQERQEHARDAEMLRSMHEITQTLVDRLHQMEQNVGVPPDYSGILVEVIEDETEDKP